MSATAETGAGEGDDPPTGRLDLVDDAVRAAITGAALRVVDGLSSILIIENARGDRAVVRAVDRLVRECAESIPALHAVIMRGGTVERDLPFGVLSQVTHALHGISDAGTDEHSDRSRALSCISRACRSAPTILVLDDVHLMDPSSLSILHSVVRRLPTIPAAVIVTGTASAVDGPDWCAARSIPIERCRVGGSGVPLSAEEVDRAMAALDESTRRVLCGIAVCDGLMDLRTVAVMMGADHLTMDQLTAALVESGLVSGHRVIHPDVRRHVLVHMPSQARTTLQIRCAHQLVISGARDLDVAGILLDTPPTDHAWTAPLLHRAAHDAQATGDRHLAARMLRRALVETAMTEHERRTVAVDLGSLETVERPSAVESRLFSVLSRIGADASPVDVRAVDLMVAAGLAIPAARALRTSENGWWHGDASSAASRSLRGLQWLANELGTGASGSGTTASIVPVGHTQAAVRAWQLAAAGIDRDSAITLARRATDEIGTDTALTAVIAAGRVLSVADLHDEAEACLGRIVSEARSRGHRAAHAWALVHRADLAVRNGRADSAERDLAMARRTLPASAWHQASWPHLAATEIVLHIVTGDLDGAREWATRPGPLGADSTLTWSFLLFTRGLVAVESDDPAAAEQWLTAAGRHLRSRGALNPALIPWRAVLADVCRGLGDEARAAALSDEDGVLSRRWSSPSAVGRAGLRAQLPSEGNAVDRAAAAVEVLRGSLSRLDYAHALVQLAEARTAAEEHPDTGALLDEAAGIVGVGGAPRLDRQIERLRRIHRTQAVRRRNAGTADPYATLTPAQRRVARSAADGLSNAQIAGTHGVTVRTVEMHLTAVYRLLGVSSRKDLPR